MEIEKYIITYSCGCKREIENKGGLHQPTGNNDNCPLHKEDK